MGIINWFKGWGSAIKIVNALDGAIKQFPIIDSKKIDTLLQTKPSWIDKDVESISKQIINGFDKKISADNVESLGQKYLDFYKTIFPEKDGNEILNKINSLKVENFIFTKINNDETLDPNEVNEIITYSKSLNIQDYDTKEKIRKDYDYYVTNWELDNGLFPTLQCDFVLQKNEVCILRVDNCELLEKKTVTKRVSYGGPSYRVKITKGFSYRVGSYNVSSQKETVDISKGKGFLNVTTQRIIFKSGEGVTTIKNSSIVDIEPYKDAVVISKTTGKPLTFKTSEAIQLYQHIRAATRH